MEAMGRGGVHSPTFPSCLPDSAPTEHLLLGPEATRMTTSPCAETRPVWETDFNQIIPKQCAVPH